LTRELSSLLKEIKESPNNSRLHEFEKLWLGHFEHRFSDEEDDPPCPMAIRILRGLHRKVTEPSLKLPWE
jgi:hypothetical protein